MVKKGQKGWKELSKHLTIDDIEKSVMKDFPLKELAVAIEQTARRKNQSIKKTAKEYYKAYFIGN